MRIEPTDIVCIGLVFLAVVWILSGCAVIQPVVSAGAGAVTHYRLETIETKMTREETLKAFYRDLEEFKIWMKNEFDTEISW